MKNHILIVLILCCLLQISCDTEATEGILFLGEDISEKFEGTYHGLADEKRKFTEITSAPVISSYKASVEIIKMSKDIIEVNITLCKGNSDGKVVLSLQADVDSDDTSLFVIQPENFPTTIFDDRKVFIIAGNGELDIRTENLDLNFILVTESSSSDPGTSSSLNTDAEITITTDAKGTGDFGC